MTTRSVEGLLLVALQVFATLSAVAGGLALVTGIIELPSSWLAGGIFSSYTIPGIILAAVVGGSQLAALSQLYRRGTSYLYGTALAGGVLMGWIIGEMIIVGTADAVMFGYQLVYFVIGFMEFALANMALRQGKSNG